MNDGSRSGSAFPATLAFQIRELERETFGGFNLDAILTVIDAENFLGYEDTSPTAKMQASYTDLILVNKWEHISERSLENVMDHLHTLNDLTPKIKCAGRNGVDPNLIFGLDTKLFKDVSLSPALDATHNEEVEVLTIQRGDHSASNFICGDPNCDHAHLPVLEQDGTTPGRAMNDNRKTPELTRELLDSSLSALPKDSVWRVKGFIRLCDDLHQTHPQTSIINWAFGRVDIVPLQVVDGVSRVSRNFDLRLTVMGERGEVRKHATVFARLLGATIY